MEWCLFDEVPGYTLPEFFQRHRWVPPWEQVGFYERQAMVLDLLGEVGPFSSVTDVGCGDGSLLGRIRATWPGVRARGIDAGEQNVEMAHRSGLDVVLGDFWTPYAIPSADVMVCTEVLEHLADPEALLRMLPGERLVVSSPVAEDGDWHYQHHAWAWDEEGYSRLVTRSGWHERVHRTCTASTVMFQGETRTQAFQAVYAERAV